MSVNQVTIYTTPTCPHCITAKRFLTERGIPFKEVDLTVDVEEQQTVLRATGMLAVPQLNVNGHWIVGFDPLQIIRYLY